MRISQKSIISGVIIVPIIWIMSGLIIYWNFEHDERGSIGDMFGAINALFSGFALFGIVISIIMQQDELGLQRKELNLTREEFKINRLTNILYKQIELINKIIETSNFELYRAGYMNHDKVDFDRYLFILDKYEREDQIQFLKDSVVWNYNDISKLIEKVADLFKSYEELLTNSSIEEEERIELRILLHSNLITSWYKLTKFLKDNTNEIDLKSNSKVNHHLIAKNQENLNYLNSYSAV